MTAAAILMIPFKPRSLLFLLPTQSTGAAESSQSDVVTFVVFFFFFPTWELIELLGAQPVFKRTMLNGTVASRYREVGGVPRHIFAEDAAYNQATRNQTTGLNMLTAEQVKNIATLEIEDLSSMDTSQPKSSVMGYRISPQDR
jgi:hypothetical protein